MQVTPQTTYLDSQKRNYSAQLGDFLAEKNRTHVSVNLDTFDTLSSIGKHEHSSLENSMLNVTSGDSSNLPLTADRIGNGSLPENDTFISVNQRTEKHMEAFSQQNITINMTVATDQIGQSTLFRSTLGYSLTVAAALSYGSLTITQKARLQHIKPVDISFFAAIPKTLVPLAVCLIWEDLTFPTQLFPVSLVLGKNI